MAADSDLNSLMSAASWWEWGEYISLAVIVIGAIAQSIHEFTVWFKHIPWWDRNGRRASALILIVASAGVFVTTVKATKINDSIIALLGNKEANTRLRAADLESQIAPRDILPTERENIVKALYPFRGKQIIINWYILDVEGFRLARQIFTILHAAGINPSPAHRLPSPTELLIGAETAGPESENAFVVAIENAFKMIGMRSHRDPTEPGSQVVLYIGVKPFRL